LDAFVTSSTTYLPHFHRLALPLDNNPHVRSIMDRTSTNAKSSLSRPSSVTSSHSSSTNKNRQYAHLHAQLAQLNAHLADMENLVRVTAVQARDMRFLGGYIGALFMGSAKVLGEESVQGKGKSGEGYSGS
jgi:hypothetical protein